MKNGKGVLVQEIGQDRNNNNFYQIKKSAEIEKITKRKLNSI